MPECTGQPGGMKTMKEYASKPQYDRIARIYDCMELPMEMMLFSRWRQELLSGVCGRILEVGVGTGKNLPYYPTDVDLTAIDISPNMLEHAGKRSIALGIPVDLRVMDAELLDLPDQYFDYVVSTFVFCSVPNPVKGLKEIRRVLKPEGTALFLEHVRSEHELIGIIMDILNPLVRTIIGPNINRRTIDNIRKAGLEIISIENKGTKIMKQIRAKVARAFDRHH